MMKNGNLPANEARAQELAAARVVAERLRLAGTYLLAAQAAANDAGMSPLAASVGLHHGTLAQALTELRARLASNDLRSLPWSLRPPEDAMARALLKQRQSAVDLVHECEAALDALLDILLYRADAAPKPVLDGSVWVVNRTQDILRAVADELSAK